MKIILDTNVLIDATHDNFSYTWKIIDLVMQGEISAFASDKILKENKLIIKRNIKNKNDKSRLENFLARVVVTPVYKRVDLIQDDPQDNKFLACAQEIKADYIISSDAHLLHLEKFQETKILSPKDFWFEYSGKNKDKDEWKDVFKNILEK